MASCGAVRQVCRSRPVCASPGGLMGAVNMHAGALLLHRLAHRALRRPACLQRVPCTPGAPSRQGGPAGTCGEGGLVPSGPARRFARMCWQTCAMSPSAGAAFMPAGVRGPHPCWPSQADRHKAVHLRTVAHGALCGLEVAQAGQEPATVSLKRVSARQLKASAAFAPAAPFIQLHGTARPLLLSRPIALIPVAWSFWP